jgi:hypothetical protein
MTKRETLIEMLKRYDDAQNTLIHSGDGSNGWPQLMPPTWNQSYRELERALRQLRSTHPEPYRHLHARYIDPWRMRAEVPVKKGGELRLPRDCELAAGQPVSGLKTAHVILNVWADWVNACRKCDLDKPTCCAVRRALDELERTYRGEPYLPAEFIAA